MWLAELRNRFRRSGGQPELQASEQAVGAEAPGLKQARNVRAGSVTDLQAKVSHLQQAIADLSRKMSDDANSGAQPTGDAKQLAAYEAELDQTQRDLARFQGRI